jgi:stage III sporulation protein SpoIIIAA
MMMMTTSANPSQPQIPAAPEPVYTVGGYIPPHLQDVRHTLANDDDLQRLLDALPPVLQEALAQCHHPSPLIEVVMDLGRLAEARFLDGHTQVLAPTHATSVEDLEHLTQLVGQFGEDNRAGITATLHRISCIRNRYGTIIGLTCRVGRALSGTITAIEDVARSGKNMLLLGRPGVGKTTRLREMARLLADELGRRVIIVDTSNEIAGDGDIPHPAVGRARRMPVKSPKHQQEVLIEAVENHTPQVIVVDEIGTEAEAQAARTIAERGVQLVATAHGNQLENVLHNPVLVDLLGGIQSVTLGDEEATRRQSQKTILEREKAPTFDVVVELRDFETLAVYEDVAKTVDALLRGFPVAPELRKLNPASGEVKVLSTRIRNVEAGVAPHSNPALAPLPPEAFLPAPTAKGSATPLRPSALSPEGGMKVFLFGLTQSLFHHVLERLGLQRLVQVTQHMHEAHALLCLRSRPGSKVLRLAADFEVPVVQVKTNTLPQLQCALREALMMKAAVWQQVAQQAQTQGGELAAWAKVTTAGLPLEGGQAITPPPLDEAEEALQEAATALETLQGQGAGGGTTVELKPRRSYLRRLQYQWLEQQGVQAVSVGAEPQRRLKLLGPTSHPRAEPH